MIVLPSLYQHQEGLRDRTRDSLAKNSRVILCANPGFGKTRCAKWILGTAANREPNERASGQSLFCVQRRGLVDNASASFAEEPKLPHGVIMSGKDSAFSRRIQVASIDSLLAWFIENDAYTTNITFDLIIYDECHSHHPKFARFLKYHDAKREELGLHPAYAIGLSATPQARGLADVYKEIVLGPSTQWLIDNGFLSAFRYFRATQGKLGLLVQKGSEFTAESEAAAMEGMAGDLVRDWKQFADGRPTVGFFPRRSHAQDAMRLLGEAGLRVAYVDGDTPDDARRTIFWQLNNGQLDYLCNVQVVERGTDIPAIACVQLCVAIGSVVRFRQMIGRGSRPDDGTRRDGSSVPAKVDCIVIDHGGNTKRHGFFEDDPQWSLDITTKDPGEAGTRPTIECPRCNSIYRGGKCRSCGYEPTKNERAGQGLDFDGRELTEVKAGDEKLAKKIKTAEELMISTLYSAGRSGRTWKQCMGIFFAASEKQGTSYRIPDSVTVGGHRYSMVRRGSEDGGRKVAQLFPFTATRGSHGGDYLVSQVQSAGAAY